MFRIKITLLSVFISGSVLVLFGIFFLTVINSVGMDRMDREVLTLGESQLHVFHSRNHWKIFDRSLRAIYGQKQWKNLIVQVTDVNQQILYQSPHWPDKITAAQFPDFDTQMATPRDFAAEPPRQRPDNSIRIDRDHLNRLPLSKQPRNFDPGRQQRNLPPPGSNENNFNRLPPELQQSNQPMEIKQPFFQTLNTPTDSWRTGMMGNQHVTILLGMNMQGFFADADKYKKTFIFSVPLALILIAVGGWILAHRALKPVRIITQTVKNITARGLDQRIPEYGNDSELLQLVTVINEMLNRLQKSFGQAVRFSADAAHELQTPLTILQGVLDNAVQHADHGTEEQRRYASLLEEVQSLKGIVQKLLILARADADQLNLQLKPVNISTLIESAAEDAEILGPQLNIETNIKPGIMVQADRDLLRLVIQGLTNNAIKYNIDRGWVRFELSVQNSQVLFCISNTGDIIPDEERTQIFDRFYRIDKSRSRRIPGSGLGLSLAKEIVRAHKGILQLKPTNDHMNTFSLSFPYLQK